MKPRFYVKDTRGYANRYHVIDNETGQIHSMRDSERGAKMLAKSLNEKFSEKKEAK